MGKALTDIGASVVDASLAAHPRFTEAARPEAPVSRRALLRLKAKSR